MKKPRITPTSRINDLEVVKADLEECLSTAEAKLVMQVNVHAGTQANPSSNCLAKNQEPMKCNIEKQDLVMEWRECEAMCKELRALSDIVTQLWESSRTSIPPWTGHSIATPSPPTVTPILLSIPNLPDAPRTKSLSPSKILAH